MFRPLFTMSLFAVVFGADWQHSEADTWGDAYPKCYGEQQSPIDIDHTVYSYMDPFEFHNYDKSNIAMHVINKGYTLQVDFNPNDELKLTGGNLPGEEYNLAQMHFHWGSKDGQGSEHTMGGMAYDAELHFVHYDNYWGGLGEAASENNGLAVLGVFFKVGAYEDNEFYDKLIDHFTDVMYNGQNKTISGFSLSSLLPMDTYFFYRYDGSLTTPPCYESVTWTVFGQPIYISQSQMEAFRMLRATAVNAEDDKLILNNYRPVQPQYDRDVWVSVMDTSGASSIVSTLSLFSIIIAQVMSLIFFH